MRQKTMAQGNATAGLKSDEKPKGVRRGAARVSPRRKVSTSPVSATAVDRAKSQPNPQRSDSQTAPSGPSASATLAAAPQSPMASPRRAGGARSATMEALAVGKSPMPAP